jgi:transposase
VTPSATLFAVAARRRAAEVNALLGASYAGIVISDRFRAYHARAVTRRQVCWAHLKRDLLGYSLYPDATGAWGQRVLDVVALVFALWHRFQQDELTRAQLQAEMQPHRAALSALWAEGACLPTAKPRGFCAEMTSLAPALWTFVAVDGVEPTNNAAERALRPAVLWRKGSFGSASDGGQQFVERILTVVATCRQQQRHLLTFLTHALSAHWASLPVPLLVTT